MSKIWKKERKTERERERERAKARAWTLYARTQVKNSPPEKNAKRVLAVLSHPNASGLARGIVYYFSFIILNEIIGCFY